MKFQVIGNGVSAKAAKRLIKMHNHQIVEENPAVLVLSPGYPVDCKEAVHARKNGALVIGEAELAFRYMQNKAIGVTGTNGKTTTVLLIEHVLKASGKKAVALGNIGHALCDYMCDPDEDEIAVVELSSFQLETVQTPIFIASGITNISPDHLDRYDSFEEYRAMKQKIAHFTKGPCYTEDVAFSLCQYLGVTKQQYDDALLTFKRPSHRLELIKKVDGLSFYNDSKGTNVDAVCYAVQNVPGPIILIAGGVDKKSSYAIWNAKLQGKVKAILAIGQASEKIAKDVDQLNVTCVKTLEKALERALKLSQGKGTILLSPGCSSFDQFNNYIHRGEEFERLVRLVYES
ncbi:MAG: UDP-N-acetylmuramoylalanine--D-glutamate ligase [Chlamydiia bacterium]|nr:UDP-N-acetylmuramoylalanine--D-glutamate ligase [Chlamydiia bacterium]MCH9615184.1 UDP-N-acetylmuramoylalanine--D-glutamate ligase [Chlamydiia bacterium]MCH9628494.1 UDP-N-acetylmuramoylalanine--D-glutamate ligase [Chlamydiia bacterium]